MILKTFIHIMIFLLIIILINVIQLPFAPMFFFFLFNYSNIDSNCKSDISPIITEIVMVFLTRIIVLFRSLFLLFLAIRLSCQKTCISCQIVSFWFQVFGLLIFGWRIILQVIKIDFLHIERRLITGFDFYINGFFDYFISAIQILILVF